MTDREGRFAGDRLYYRAWGHPPPRAHVIIAHGVVEQSGRYEHVAARLQDAGLAVWAMDHRGHGRSQGTRADMIQFRRPSKISISSWTSSPSAQTAKPSS